MLILIPSLAIFQEGSKDGLFSPLLAKLPTDIVSSCLDVLVKFQIRGISNATIRLNSDMLLSAEI